ncbi:MAG: Asparagine synthetase (glutamine-hydrolyzing), partial [Acidobacteria bacterium]|nr:Asparagine synthetase (glutamine-hydrolyzing) [Acidobacteriota bacterium]
RQAKFIVNSVRVYDSFDKRWALPLWDNDLMDFFMRLAVPAKWHKRIYINTLLSRVFSRELSELKTIPVSSTTRLVYRAASAPAVKSSSSILKKSLLSFPYVNSIPVMVRNYVNDVFHMYGCFTESTSLTQLLKPAKSVLHVAPNGSASGLFRITEPHTGKPILMLSRGGLFGARYVLELMNSGNRATQ